MDVIRVNKEWIFYRNGNRHKATPEVIQEIMDAARADARFYDRMYHELGQMYTKEKVNFDFGRPAPDTNTYHERVGALSGLSDAMKEANKKTASRGTD